MDLFRKGNSFFFSTTIHIFIFALSALALQQPSALTLRDIGVAYIDGCFDAHLTLTVRSRAPYAHLDTGVSAWFAWKTSIAGPNWHRIDVNLNLSLQLVPLRICARVLGFNVCVP